MTRFVRGIIFGVGLAFFAPFPPAACQGQSAQAGDFFSGNVVSVSATVLTVNRKGLGKDTSETRTFTIDGSTKVEGKLKPQAHVTVRFVADENGGARAVHIIVR
ncbi:MAG: hypothetical protein M3Z09_17675 [Acidobacteriota bacterium]|nr:hypothetical protein [Acidobacteriota bacterium]